MYNKETTNEKCYSANLEGYTLNVGKAIAFNVVNQIFPYCDKIHIAGSIRREKAFIKDIEIICMPKKIILKDDFGWDEGVIVDFGFQKEIENIGEIQKGDANGKYMQIRLPEGINLDLFMPNASDYYRQLTIRTGSAEYVRTVIARAWVKRGWVGTSRGLRRREDCKNVSGKWIIVNDDGELPPVWESEEEFFEWLNVEWAEPRERYIK